MSDRIQLESIPNIPYIFEGDEVGEVILSAAQLTQINFKENDILCVASKAVSVAEGRVKALASVDVSDIAMQIGEKVPRKDPRVIQLIIEETGALDGSRVDVGDNYIAGWLPNGLRLTSSGVDKHGSEEVILLPKDPDKSALLIGQKIMKATGVNVGVIITDSDGRIDKRGATQVAIGVYGVPPLRITHAIGGQDSPKKTEETTCDMLAASAGLIMGQRGTNKPVVLVRGHDYEFNPNATINDALN